jgi:ribonucleotide reductase beta subunit family protein with ferritin-like domain
MSLLKVQGSIPIYKPSGGFRYPQALEYYERHDSMVWHKSEISLSQDIKDYATSSPEIREFITQVMRLFVQNDTLAGTGYDTLLRIIKPTEVQMMLRSFDDRESTHIFNYANFIDTIGLPASTYTEFLEIPVMSSKTEYLDKAKVRKYEDYKSAGLTDAEVDYEFRRDVARMIAVYAGGLEGITLYAQFAMLLMFQQQGKFPGLADIVLWSINKSYEC